LRRYTEPPQGKIHLLNNLRKLQSLGSGSVGSARFWLLGPGSAKVCGSTDLDPKGKIATKKLQKNLTLKLKK